MRLRHLWLLLALVVFMAPLAAQERFGGLSGTVMDPQKLAVPGATVTATNKGTGVARTAVTTADGSFMIPDLDPGRYTVTVELQGFQKATADDVLVLLGKTYQFSPELKPGGVTEIVNVTGDAEKADRPEEHDGRAQRHGGRVRSHARRRAASRASR